jgi:chaperone BCS1
LTGLFFHLGASYHFTFLRTTGSLYEKPRIEFDKLHFSTSKSFDNLFYEGKQALLDRLDFFLHNPQYYKQRGIAHSLGLMFYGAPGEFIDRKTISL